MVLGTTALGRCPTQAGPSGSTQGVWLGLEHPGIGPRASTQWPAVELRTAGDALCSFSVSKNDGDDNVAYVMGLL